MQNGDCRFVSILLQKCFLETFSAYHGGVWRGTNIKTVRDQLIFYALKLCKSLQLRYPEGLMHLNEAYHILHLECLPLLGVVEEKWTMKVV